MFLEYSSFGAYFFPVVELPAPPKRAIFRIFTFLALVPVDFVGLVPIGPPGSGLGLDRAWLGLGHETHSDQEFVG